MHMILVLMEKKKSYRRDEENAQLWSIGQQSIIYFADVCVI